jgi:ProP effector
MDPRNRPGRSAQAREIVAILAEFWPNCFVLYEQRRRPLKVGIRDDLTEAAAAALTPAEIALALRHYTSSLPYLRACYTGADRIDLNGQVAGRVTAHEAAQAAAKLAQIRRVILARKTETSIAPPNETITLPERRLTLSDLLLNPRLMAHVHKAAAS